MSKTTTITTTTITIVRTIPHLLPLTGFPEGHGNGKAGAPKDPAHERSRWSRARREAARSQGVMPGPPVVAGYYSSSTKVTSTLTL
jgi:hypothetical protein